MTSSSPGSAIPARQATLLVAFMWFAYFLNYGDRQVVFAMFPALKADLKLSDTHLGLTGSVFLWIYAIGCPIAGQFADRISKRQLVVLSLVVWSVVTAATGLANSALTLLLLRAAMGVSESLYMPAAIALTAGAHPPERRSRAIAALTTAQIAGTVAGGWFGGWMAQQGRWREAFFILGAVGLLFAAPYFAFLRGVPETQADAPHPSGARLAVGELVRVPTFLVLCLAFPAFVFGLWLLYGWLPNFLHEKFHLDLAAAAFNATVFLQGATLIGMLSGGVLADVLFKQTQAARFWLLAGSLILCAPFLRALGAADTLAATRLAAIGFGLFSGFFMGNIFPAAFEVVPAHTRASAVGVLNFFGAAMSGVATLLGGAWKQSVGLDRLLSVTSLVYLAAAVLVMLGVRYLFPADLRRNQTSP